ncbi:hypothetical protein [Motiliproteus sediminis]|uniref:hypothetical protein n=1 Tax=Motiliproteus sediminis TaxID=1468178 RepID=UPI001AEFB87A|nr:hypothetical protein [Motiliproteus sediminis]
MFRGVRVRHLMHPFGRLRWLSRFLALSDVAQLTWLLLLVVALNTLLLSAAGTVIWLAP